MQNNPYQTHKSTRELNQQLLIGMKKHLQIAQDTTQSKSTRLQSLSNLQEVLEYVCGHINEACGPDEVAIYQAFFSKTLIRIVKAKVDIHNTPLSFNDEIGFLNIMSNI